MSEEEPQVVPERRDFTPMARELFVNFQAVEPTVEWLKAAQGAVELSSGFAGLVENIIATVSVATIPWRQQRQTFFEQFVKNTLPLERERDPSLPQSDFHPKVKELLVQRFKEYAESVPDHRALRHQPGEPSWKKADYSNLNRRPDRVPTKKPGSRKKPGA